MNRRDFITGLLLAPPALSTGSGCRAQNPSQGLDVVDAFGFSPDGSTDNYEAFRRWSAHVNRVRGGNYLFPPGVYYVARYRSSPGGATRLGRAEIVPIENCDGLSVSGYGARIRLNGRFHRSARPGPTGVPIGRHLAAFMPFALKRCRNVTISGFDMDGGVRSMRRDAEITEAYSHLIALHGCSDVTLRDLDLHHSQTDAIFLAADPGANGARACRNIELQNVRCRNNARGGLGIIQAFGVTSTDCSFDDNGYGLGDYEGHAPRFGVTVEPDYSPPQVDVRSGNIMFTRCQFHGNATAFAGVYADRVQGYFRVIDCRTSNARGSTYPIMLNWPGALIEGGTHDTGAGTLWTSWDGARGGDLTIRNCEIRTSSAYGIFHAHPGNIVHLERVRIVGTHSTPLSPGWVLAIQGNPGGGRRNTIQECELFIPARRKAPGADYDYEVSLYHTLSRGNLFRTDLPAVGNQHFCTEYGPGAVASGDRYQGASPGLRDSFRPSAMSAHDTRTAFRTR